LKLFHRVPIALAAAALPIAVFGGCGDDTEPPPPAPAAAAPAAAAPAPAAPPPAAATAAAKADAGGPPLREFSEEDFNETDKNRDPFRSFQQLFVTQAKGRLVTQKTVLVDRYALDQLRLVGIVARNPARALVLDPTGLGWVIKNGDFIGKAELVHAGGPTGTDVAINWRVDRVRDGDVVFIREDPSHPEIPPTTRVIPLHPVKEGERQL
jgi:type IV pilus assembly protein PilP